MITINIALSTWLTHIPETIRLTIFALNSLAIFVRGTDAGQSLIAVSIGLTFVGDFLASIGVGVTEVSSLNKWVGWDFIKLLDLLHCSQSPTDIRRCDLPYRLAWDTDS